MPKLYVLSGPDLGKTVVVGADATIGRAPDCTLVLRDISVSRYHAKLELDGDDWSVVDTQSRNGLRIRGERVPSVELSDGGEFVVGEVLLRFRADNSLTVEPEPPRVLRPAPAPANLADSDEIQLEGDWDESAAPAPQIRNALAQTQVRERPLESSLASQGQALPGAGSAEARDKALQRAKAAGVRVNQGASAAVTRDILQYNRVDERGGGVFSADFSQLSLGMRALLVVLALALFGGIFYVAFNGTTLVKARADVVPDSNETAPEETR
jgi:hypothetical protein